MILKVSFQERIAYVGLGKNMDGLPILYVHMYEQYIAVD